MGTCGRMVEGGTFVNFHSLKKYGGKPTQETGNIQGSFWSSRVKLSSVPWPKIKSHVYSLFLMSHPGVLDNRRHSKVLSNFPKPIINYHRLPRVQNSPESNASGMDIPRYLVQSKLVWTKIWPHAGTLASSSFIPEKNAGIHLSLDVNDRKNSLRWRTA